MFEAQRDRSSPTDISTRLTFFKALQALTTRIHAAQDVDDIVIKLSERLCEVFDSERLTIYTTNETGDHIVARVKTGLEGIRRIDLPIDDTSIAGYAALTRRTLNVFNVYDEQELAAISPRLHFNQDLDRSTGYRSREMLVAPIVDTGSDRLVGVIQFINHRHAGPFPTVMEDGLLALAQTLAVAFSRREPAATFLRSRFDALVVDGHISAVELDTAVKRARETGAPIESALIELYSLQPEVIGGAAARFFNVPYESYKPDRIKQVDLLKNIKREFVAQNQWLPLEETPEGLIILTTDPEQVRVSKVVNNVFPKKRLVLRVTTREEFQRTLDQFFEPSLEHSSVDDLLSDMQEEEQDASLADELNAAADNELVKLVNKIIIDAHRQGASDIHIEPRPGKEKTLIRFRKDGTLVPYIQVPASYRNPLITRIKIMCDLDISERRRPQDGKIKFRKYAPLDIEIRVATLPTAGGLEDVVMRLLTSGEPLPIDKLGLSPDNLARLKEAVSLPYGMFLVCGPTGSGKTTTLHSILGHIKNGEVKIWTAEDPVEITQNGLRQVQVNRKAGLDFAVLMRAFLRADPDVIMVGEMRDAETVATGIEASLTGHLVLSTLHTNSAPESVVRLLDMGMDPFNFADALIGVLAQRLTKCLCTRCREAYVPTQQELALLLDEYCSDLKETAAFRTDTATARSRIFESWRNRFADAQGRFTLYRPKGCDACTNGYKGRVGLHELMLVSPQLKRQIQERDRVDNLLATALSDGMRSLRQDGIEKTLAGITDMSQVRKVCVR